jgi:molecular chaperone GrpE (heat shock protein)
MTTRRDGIKGGESGAFLAAFQRKPAGVARNWLLQNRILPPRFMATEPDFDLQMRSLAEEAQHVLEAVPGGRRPEPALIDFLRPLAQHIESLGRTVKDNTMAIMRIEETVLAQSHIATLPRLITALHDDLENRNGVNQKLFDALHEELKGYKDGFLLEILHRPLIRDLIVLYDDLSELHRRTASALETMKANHQSAELLAARTQLQQLATNLDHIVDSLLEVLARMDVRRLEPSGGKLDKLNQRVLNTQPAEHPGEDLTVASSLKPGFLWRERTIRAEEVIVKKWKPESAPVPCGAGSQ